MLTLASPVFPLPREAQPETMLWPLLLNAEPLLSPRPASNEIDTSATLQFRLSPRTSICLPCSSLRDGRGRAVLSSLAMLWWTGLWSSISRCYFSTARARPKAATVCTDGSFIEPPRMGTRKVSFPRRPVHCVDGLDGRVAVLSTPSLLASSLCWPSSLPRTTLSDSPFSSYWDLIHISGRRNCCRWAPRASTHRLGALVRCLRGLGPS